MSDIGGSLPADTRLTQEQVAAGYDQIADVMYEEDVLYEDVLRLAPDCQGRTLDVGCGQGRLLQHIERRFSGVELFGCDISPRLCDLARQRVPGADIRVDVAEGLPRFERATFDFVFLVATLEHTQSHESALAAAFNVLKPSGVMLIATTNRGWTRYERWRRDHVQVEPVDHYWFTSEELKGLLRQARFDIEQVAGGWSWVRGGAWHAWERRAARLIPAIRTRMKMLLIRSRKPD